MEGGRIGKVGVLIPELSLPTKPPPPSSGILVPGGFGVRGSEGMLLAIKWAREQSIPYLGICLGFQLAVIEWARNVCGLTGMLSSTVFLLLARCGLICRFHDRCYVGRVQPQD